jgi:Na+/H+ antiporter NhaC
VPLAVLLPSILVFYYFLHPVHGGASVSPRFPITLTKVQAALGSNAGPAAFVLGSTLALVVAALCYPKGRRAEVPATARHGAVQMLAPLGILVLAWVFGSVLKAQGTAEALSQVIGDTLPARFFPAAVFLAGCAIAFVSGSSWGTMGLLMPLVLPALGPLTMDTPDDLARLAPSVIAAVFGGAVFGDHCSPFSDTTIVSAIACGISTPEHTLTQLPYALIAAGVALVLGYGLDAFGLPGAPALVAGLVVLVALTALKVPDPPPPVEANGPSARN